MPCMVMRTVTIRKRWHSLRSSVRIVTHDADWCNVFQFWRIMGNKKLKLYVLWNSEAKIPSLEHDNSIVVQITQVDLFSLRNDIRVLFNQQPSDVREEETVFGIVRVGIGFGVLMVNTMVPRPFKNIILCSDAVHHHQSKSQGPSCFERTMRPKSVNTNCNTKSSNEVT